MHPRGDTSRLLRGAAVYAAAAATQSGSVLAAAMFAATYLDTISYADFSFVQYSALLLALFLDAGIGQSALRGSAASNDLGILIAGIRLKWAVLFGASIVLGVASILSGDAMYIVVGIAAAASSLNATVRVYDSQCGDLRGMAITSAAMVTASAIGVTITVMSRDWLFAAIATLAIPPLASAVIRLRRSELPRKGVLRPAVRAVGEFAPYMFVSGLLFAALVPAALILLKPSLPAVEYGALALSSSLVGALSLLVTSYRATGYRAFAEVLTDPTLTAALRVGHFVRKSSFLIGAYTLGGVAVCLFADVVYAHKYPGIVPATAALCVGFGITGVSGLYNIRHQVRGLKRLEIAVNVIRLLGVVVLSLSSVNGAWFAAAGIAVAVAGGELCYALIGDLYLDPVRPGREDA